MFANGIPWEPILIGLVALVLLLQLMNLARDGDQSLRRLERKIDAVIKHLGLPLPDASQELSAAVKKLADEPGGKISAIKLQREETGMGLAEAKDAVEEYLRSRPA
jgi:ribosomal protein L7/L12